MERPVIDVVTFATAHCFGDALPSSLRLRHKIFVEQQQYDVPSFDGMEFDQFDTPAAVYLLWRDGDGKVRAVARLIPTTFPYMIQQLWPHLAADATLPNRPDIWEVTRLGIDPDLDPAGRKRAFGEIVCALGEFAMLNGVTSYLFVTHPRIMKNVLAGSGCAVELLGPAQVLGTFTVIAGNVTITAEALERARTCHGITGSILRFQSEHTVNVA